MSEHPEQLDTVGAGAAEAQDEDLDFGAPPSGEPPDAGAGGSGDGPDGDGGDPSDTGGGDDDGDAELDEVDVKDLLRDALAPPRTSGHTIAAGVHRRLREGSGGRYFADGWSTTPAPRATFLVTSLLMLLVIALAWLFLSPWDVRPLP
jgi:hypothetical protein